MLKEFAQTNATELSFTWPYVYCDESELYTTFEIIIGYFFEYNNAINPD